MDSKAAAFLLFEVWDLYRLWSQSPDLISSVESLDLDVISGNALNAYVLRHLLSVVRQAYFFAVPSACLNSGSFPSRSPGRLGPGGDWVYYDHCRRELIHDPVVAHSRANALERTIPDGFGRSWGAGVSVEGWQEAMPNGDAPVVGG